MEQHDAGHVEAGHAGRGTHPVFNPWNIFFLLVGLTAISWASDKLTLSATTIGLLVMTVSTCKASLVVAYFMHFKFEGTWKYVLTVPPLVMAFFLACALIPDVGLRQHLWQ